MSSKQKKLKEKKQKADRTPHGRFYESEYPDVGDVVAVQVTRIDVAMGVYVNLLEYNGIRGFVPFGDLTVMSPSKTARIVGEMLRSKSTQVCVVTAIDTKKACIDLSKRQVMRETAVQKYEAFVKAKVVHAIMWRVAVTNDLPVEELCNKVSWPLHKRYGKDVYEVFEKHLNKELNVWDQIDFSQPGRDLSAIAQKLKADVELNVLRRLAQRVQHLRAKVEVSCSGPDGIDAIREALQRGLEISKEDCELKINLVTSPLFLICCSCRDKDLGVLRMQEAMDCIKTCIQTKGGSFVIKLPPVLAGEEGDYECLDDESSSFVTGSERLSASDNEGEGLEDSGQDMSSSDDEDEEAADKT